LPQAVLFETFHPDGMNVSGGLIARSRLMLSILHTPT
jgi:hypothetical protein